MFLMCIYSVVLSRAARSSVGSRLYDINSKSDARIRITVLLALHNVLLEVYGDRRVKAHERVLNVWWNKGKSEMVARIFI